MGGISDTSIHSLVELHQEFVLLHPVSQLNEFVFLDTSKLHGSPETTHGLALLTTTMSLPNDTLYDASKSTKGASATPNRQIALMIKARVGASFHSENLKLLIYGR